ncbi:hypothetical protein OHB26_00305 [Nocardia sp. NBC_01503]|uniref:hypothetical protein n=1 Tax=Nocardia sp. NBC_01503 TaxID=2975997 RepID=UPI002E7C2211|nr:hypothetical protein [Nocardia sp. NBC_01503]WTL32757.1 hypothetical protein OHB26_00305 [Nocardia sp. NBC_01503]
MIGEAAKRGRRVVEDRPIRPILPDWHELFAAFCGHLGEEPDAHPITACARALAELNQADRRNPGWQGFTSASRVLIDSVDTWVRQNAPHPARVGESLGELIARMALAQVTANELLRQCDSVDEDVHTAWQELAVMAGRWTDLVAEVVDGQPLFPKDKHQ